MNVITNYLAHRLLMGQFDWTAATLNVALVDDTYAGTKENSPNPSDALIGTSDTLTGLAILDGWAKADHAHFATLVDGRQITKALLCNAGDDGAVMAIIEDAVGMPAYVPSGPFWLAWNAEGIFRL